MIFIGEQSVELPCPDYTTASNCWGKIKITIQSYRIARGRGEFIITVDAGEPDKPVEFKCSRCKRKFRFEPPTDKLPDLFFIPVREQNAKKLRPSAVFLSQVKIAEEGKKIAKSEFSKAFKKLKK